MVTQSVRDDLDDAARWWRAYQLAENDQAGELRQLAAAGDDHARRQLASWLSDRAFSGSGLLDRARLEEAIAVIRPLADAGDDVAELWLARWLADCDLHEELRELIEGADPGRRQLIFDAVGGVSSAALNTARMLADLGDQASRMHLARVLAREGRLDELRERVDGGGDYAAHWLADALRQRFRREC